MCILVEHQQVKRMEIIKWKVGLLLHNIVKVLVVRETAKSVWIRPTGGGANIEEDAGVSYKCPKRSNPTEYIYTGTGVFDSFEEAKQYMLFQAEARYAEATALFEERVREINSLTSDACVIL